MPPYASSAGSISAAGCGPPSRTARPTPSGRGSRRPGRTAASPACDCGGAAFAGAGAELHRERARLVRREVGHELALHERRGADGLLDAVDLARGGERCGERERARPWPACRRVRPARTTTSSLCSAFLTASTRTRVLLTLSSENVLPSVPACFARSNASSGWLRRCALPVGLALAPVAGVAGQPVDELVMAAVLRRLVVDSRPRIPGVRMSVSRSVLSSGLSDAILQSVSTVTPNAAGLVGQVEPLVRRAPRTAARRSSAARSCRRPSCRSPSGSTRSAGRRP